MQPFLSQVLSRYPSVDPMSLDDTPTIPIRSPERKVEIVWLSALCGDDMGIRAFIFSGYPHLDECELFGKYVLPRLDTCAECGIRYLDTAEIYGLYRVEEALGRVFGGSPSLRESMGIVTKGGIDVPSEEKSHARLPHYNATGDNLVACAEKSLKLLNVDVLDLSRQDWYTIW